MPATSHDYLRIPVGFVFWILQHVLLRARKSGADIDLMDFLESTEVSSHFTIADGHHRQRIAHLTDITPTGEMGPRDYGGYRKTLISLTCYPAFSSLQQYVLARL